MTFFFFKRCRLWERPGKVGLQGEDGKRVTGLQVGVRESREGRVTTAPAARSGLRLVAPPSTREAPFRAPPPLAPRRLGSARLRALRGEAQTWQQRPSVRAALLRPSPPWGQLATPRAQPRAKRNPRSNKQKPR